MPTKSRLTLIQRDMSDTKYDGKDTSDGDNSSHNKGQEDASKGVYSPPSGNFNLSDEDARNNDEYNKGWRNHEDQ
jgi:hypothetical protein